MDRWMDVVWIMTCRRQCECEYTEVSFVSIKIMAFLLVLFRVDSLRSGAMHGYTTAKDERK